MSEQLYALLVSVERAITAVCFGVALLCMVCFGVATMRRLSKLEARLAEIERQPRLLMPRMELPKGHGAFDLEATTEGRWAVSEERNER